MIRFRLREAGYQSRLPLFTDEAVEAVHDYAEGYPRRISMLCHQALRALVMTKGRVVDDPLVDELVRQEQDVGWFRPKRLQKSSSSV